MTRAELTADRLAAIARYERAEAERDALVARIAQLERELAGTECPTCAGPMDRDGCIECRKSDARHSHCVEALRRLLEARAIAGNAQHRCNAYGVPTTQSAKAAWDEAELAARAALAEEDKP